MITRRNFITTAAVNASSPASLCAGEQEAEKPRAPLRAEPRVRTLHARPADGKKLKLYSDRPDSPPKLIRQEALEREFGSGTHLVLNQPDHWRMIEEGWFKGDDLYELTSYDDPAMWTWAANYRPETEAHDLLYYLFEDRIALGYAVLPGLATRQLAKPLVAIPMENRTCDREISLLMHGGRTHSPIVREFQAFLLTHLPDIASELGMAVTEK